MSLGHISNSLPLALETIMILVSMMTWHQMELRCHSRFCMRIWNCVHNFDPTKVHKLVYLLTCQTWLCKSDILGIGYRPIRFRSSINNIKRLRMIPSYRLLKPHQVNDLSNNLLIMTSHINDATILNRKSIYIVESTHIQVIW